MTYSWSRRAIFKNFSLASGAALFARTRADAQNAGSNALNQRIRNARRLRLDAARINSDLAFPRQQTNGDSERYSSYLANFSKGLAHDQNGIVDLTGYQSLLQAVQSGRWQDFENISLGGSAKLVNPIAAFAYSLEGADSHQSWTPAPPAFASDEQAAEMVELYWQALTRDIPFSQFDSDPIIRQACADLTSFGPQTGNGTTPVTPANIFRLPLPGNLTGPYVSQFLLLDVPIDNEIQHQQYSMLGAATDSMANYGEFLGIQNGAVPGPGSPLTKPRYTTTSRDLVSYVHKDFPYQADQSAAFILAGFGGAALSEGNPYKHAKTQSAFTTYGLPAFIDWIGRATTSALKASWYQKWAVHRRIRPEEFGGRVHNQVIGKLNVPISNRLFQSNALNLTYNAQGTYLLSQAYQEGCPLHPSYPAGHAAIAGACITVLKTLFDEQYVIPKPVVPVPSADSLVPYIGDPLTVGGELNKLAANIAFSRDAAGVHWRSDSVAGLMMGEAVAVRLLADLLCVTPELPTPLTFHNFSGDPVTINPTVPQGL